LRLGSFIRNATSFPIDLDARAGVALDLFYCTTTVSQQADDLDLVQVLAGVVVVYLVAGMLPRVLVFFSTTKK